MYGIRQAPRAWNQLVTAWLIEYGWTQSKVDPGAYTIVVRGAWYILAIYVDDCILVGRDGPFLNQFIEDFGTRFKIEFLGPAAWLLGCSIVRDRSAKILRLGQKQYFLDMLEDFGMSDCTPSGTPFPVKTVDGQDVDSPPLDLKEFKYPQLVGKLLYASNCTRPDITAAVNYLARFMQRPTEHHWQLAKRLLRYIRGTVNYCLTFGGAVSPVPVCWQDASFADGPGRKSRTGFVIMMCGSAVVWGSRLQPTVALSTVEAEYMAMCAAAQELLFISQLMQAFGMTLKVPLQMFEDNKGCIALATNPMTTGKTKHIDVIYHFVRDLVQSGKLRIVWCESEKMLADILTKFSLPARQHLALSALIMSGRYSWKLRSQGPGNGRTPTVAPSGQSA